MKMFFTGGNLCGTDATGYPPPEEVIDRPDVLFTFFDLYRGNHAMSNRMGLYYDTLYSEKLVIPEALKQQVKQEEQICNS